GGITRGIIADWNRLANVVSQSAQDSISASRSNDRTTSVHRERSRYRILKRAVDPAIAACAVVLLVRVMAIVAQSIRPDSSGRYFSDIDAKSDVGVESGVGRTSSCPTAKPARDRRWRV